jgi:HSP20 family molecular chaperone IbpA
VAPGFDKQDFNISVDDGLLTISAIKVRMRKKKIAMPEENLDTVHFPVRLIFP